METRSIANRIRTGFTNLTTRIYVECANGLPGMLAKGEVDLVKKDMGETLAAMRFHMCIYRIVSDLLKIWPVGEIIRKRWQEV